MAVTELETSLRPHGGLRSGTAIFSLATLAVICAALLIYVSGTFQIAAIFNGKQQLQVLLIVPIAAAASYYFVSSPARLWHPLICFAVLKLVTEIAMRGQMSYVLDSLAAMFGVTVLVCAPPSSFRAGTKVAVTFAGILALMALVQWAFLMWDPTLGRYGLVISDEDVLQNSVDSPIALLGFVGEQSYMLLGHPVVRLQSFAKEPSLNVVYFMLPACTAFLLCTRAGFIWGVTILTFCVLSLSGSVFLALAFAGLWWVLLRVSSVRFAIPWGMLLLMGGFLFTVQHFGLDSLLNAIEYLAQFGDVLNKNTSLTDRSTGALLSLGAALAAPFGSSSLAVVPGPWLISSALAAGWLGVLVLLWFLHGFGRDLDVFFRASRPGSGRWLGSLVLIGALGTVIVFNDYQMSNYAGLIVLAFIHRTLRLQNQRDAAARAEVA